MLFKVLGIWQGTRQAKPWLRSSRGTDNRVGVGVKRCEQYREDRMEQRSTSQAQENPSLGIRDCAGSQVTVVCALVENPWVREEQVEEKGMGLARKVSVIM